MMIKKEQSLLNIIIVAYVSLLRLCLKNTNPSIVLSVKSSQVELYCHSTTCVYI